MTMTLSPASLTPPHATPSPPSRRDLTAAIRASLHAKLDRMLARPIIAGIPPTKVERPRDPLGAAAVFLELQVVAIASGEAVATPPNVAWREDPEDGTWTVRIDLDYDDLWRGREREILETVTSTVESPVTFLTDAQRLLLERSPREFLALDPRPESAELVSFERENVGGSVRVTELRVAAAPESRAHIRHVAIVPNLVQIERQLDALYRIERATDEGPLAPLRALVGLGDAARLKSEAVEIPVIAAGARLDEHQTECVHKALATPHFAVIQGPPGSGKTTVIREVIRLALGRGERALVVSPTHVAVDNVVEKLVPPPGGEDGFEEHSLPVRYAARPTKLHARALGYWVGRKKQRRGATVARRVETCLKRAVPFAERLFGMEDKDAAGRAPISNAVAAVERVLCGTPIGLLSYEAVKTAEPGAFDVLIVDEVSKMTLPEFLAIAVKARRWVLVGDPEQLPPFNNAEENGETLGDVLDPRIELVCSVGGIVERCRPAVRQGLRLVVVASDPERARAAISAHLDAVLPGERPAVTSLANPGPLGILVCSAADVPRACLTLSPSPVGGVDLLVERGVRVPRPEFASGARLVEARLRAPALLFENSFNVYHTQPWGSRARQKLPVVRFRNGIEKYLPSAAALGDVAGVSAHVTERRRQLVEAIAERLALNTVSVYDWLTGLPTEHMDTSPLRELAAFTPEVLRATVRPFVGVLKKQYRMHPSLSRVPRELFYSGEALHDGRPNGDGTCRVQLVQVSDDHAERESNVREVERICALLSGLDGRVAARERRPEVMVITPYRAQEDLLQRSLDDLRLRGLLAHVEVEVCTLDRCQGREAEFVMISLVRDRATPFLDMPKRWNVALTRAREGLFVIGNINAYLDEAARERRDPRALRAGRVQMSLIARVLEAYREQIQRGQS